MFKAKRSALEWLKSARWKHSTQITDRERTLSSVWQKTHSVHPSWPVSLVPFLFSFILLLQGVPGYLSRYSDSLRAERSGDRILVEARFSSPIQTGTGAQPAFCRLHLKREGARAETRFRLSAKRTSPFKSAGASVLSTTVNRGVRISVSNAV